VDGLNDPTVEAGRWHFVYVDLTAGGTVPLSDAGRPVRFAHINEKAVLNYIASHSTAVSPTNLYASRFGITDQAVFGDDYSSALHYGVTETLTMQDDFTVSMIAKPATPGANGAIPNSTVRISLDDNSAVV
jgi:hypothetical protein